MRRQSRQIRVGTLKVGGEAPISVQSMTNTPTADIESTVRQIDECAAWGADAMRLAINSSEDAQALQKIHARVSIPLIADIQYDYKLAIEAAKNSADCIRINPGNMPQKKHLRELVRCLNAYDIPIRVGVNSGSISKDLLKTFHGVNEKSLVHSALQEVQLLEDLGFTKIKVAIKSSDVYTCVASYRTFAQLRNYPLHIGITEAGPYEQGVVKSAIGIGTLLLEGIGDTIRVSLTDQPYREVQAGITILNALKLRAQGIHLISCPTCSRTNGDLIRFVEAFQKRMPKTKKPICVAIMGCPVNGPGEAREADIGIAMQKSGAVIFERGKKIAYVDRESALDVLLEHIEQLDR